MKRYLLLMLLMVATVGNMGVYAQTTKKTTTAKKTTTTAAKATTAKKPTTSTQAKTTTTAAKKTTTSTAAKTRATTTTAKTTTTTAAKKAPAKTTTNSASSTKTTQSATTTQPVQYYNNKSNTNTTTTTTRATTTQNDSKYARSGSKSTKSSKSTSSSIDKPFRRDFKVKYMGEAHLGFTGKDVRTSQVRLGTMQGVSIGKYGDVGIGVDAAMFTGYPKGGDFPILHVDPHFFIRPAFPITKDLSVLLHTSMGVTIPVLNTKGDPTFEVELGPGIRFKKLRADLGIDILVPQGGTAVYPYAKVGIYF